MDWRVLGGEVVARLRESLASQPVVSSTWLLLAVGAGLASVLVAPLWRGVRIVVTVVHELGHAVVGVVCGRKFTGFVVNPDMSGHTVTAGRPRGPGRMLTTFAGYPMPALVGSGLCVAASAGWSALVLVVGFLLLFAAIRARSLYTVLTLVVLVVAVAAVWWWGGAAPQAAVVCGVGVVLLLGGWRQLAAVIRDGDKRQDPAVLADLTRIPAPVWNLVHVLICAVATWWTARLLVPLLLAAVPFVG